MPGGRRAGKPGDDGGLARPGGAGRTAAMRNGGLQGIGRIAALLALLGFVLLGFGHRASAGERLRADPALAEYLALGGTLDALCLGEDGHDGGKLHPDCPACMVGKIAAVPEALTLPRRVGRKAEPRLRLPAVAVAAGSPRAPPGRGPPVG
jgi:hypothetical protein